MTPTDEGRTKPPRCWKYGCRSSSLLYLFFVIDLCWYKTITILFRELFQHDCPQADHDAAMLPHLPLLRSQRLAVVLLRAGHPSQRHHGSLHAHGLRDGASFFPVFHLWQWLLTCSTTCSLVVLEARACSVRLAFAPKGWAQSSGRRQ